jgi:hypothetical protein
MPHPRGLKGCAFFASSEVKTLTGDGGGAGGEGDVEFVGHQKMGIKTAVTIWLVVWNMNFMNFHILGMSSSQLTNIFFRGVGQPPTRQKVHFFC